MFLQRAVRHTTAGLQERDRLIEQRVEVHVPPLREALGQWCGKTP
jgi:hypothetical protein